MVSPWTIASYWILVTILCYSSCSAYRPSYSMQNSRHRYSDEVRKDEMSDSGPLIGFLMADFRIKNKHGRSVPWMEANRRNLIFVLTDETMQILEGDHRYRNCDVIIQCVPGAHIDHITRLILQYQNRHQPDWLIIHLGANDIVPEVPMTAAIVVSKLKRLVQQLMSFSNNGRKPVVAISSLLPQPGGHPYYNKAVEIINDQMMAYSKQINLRFIDHDLDLFVDGKLFQNYFMGDNRSINRIGALKVKRRIFESLACKQIQTEEIGPARSRAKRKLELSDILPKEQRYYDKHVPPKKDGGPTVVYFHVTVLSIDTIDEESMTYVADIFLAQTWQDYRLRLPDNMTEEYRILDIEWLKYIWSPDTFVKNAKQVTFHEMSVPNHYIWIYQNKNILYMAKMSLVLSCPMMFKDYPHDTQTCSMLIESLSHRTDDLVFLWNLSYPLVINPDMELPQLDVLKSETKDCTLEYSTGNFTCLAVVFTLRRRLGYQLLHTYIPTALIVVMSWISFWISPEAVPARVTLGVTSLLTLATQNTQSQASLPPVSYVKAIDVWMSSCTVFVFCSLMEYAIVTHFMRYSGKPNTDQDDQDDPDVLTRRKSETSLLRGLQRQFMLRKMNTVDMLLGNTAPYKQDMRISLAIDNFSRFFFPFSFIVLNIIYWKTFL
ncbi:Hiscl2 (predicted) [Pycnogonum litorale]